MSQLPAALTPSPGARGLATADLAGLGERVIAGWQAFLDLASAADLDRPSRKTGWSGFDVVVHLGAWEDARTLDDILDDARRGRVHTVDQSALGHALITDHAGASREEALGAVRAALDTAVEWFGDLDAAGEDALRPTASPLGALPVATLLHAAVYQLACSALDLEPCGVEVGDDLLDAGVVALVDSTGALAARKGATASLSASTGAGVWGFGATRGDWAALALDEPAGPAVHAASRVILDITAGRTGQVAALYGSGQLRVHDLPGLLRLAPLIQDVPGIPGGAALGAATRYLGGLSRIAGLFRRG